MPRIPAIAFAAVLVALAASAAFAFAQSDGGGNTRIELRVWESASDPARNFVSARAEGGSWADLGTVPVTLDGLSASGAYRYGDLVLTVAHDAPLTPAEARELTELRDRNAELAAQVERLRAENAELRARPTPTPTPTPTVAPSISPEAAPTAAPAPSGGGGTPSTATPTRTPGGTATPAPSATPSPTPTPTPTPRPLTDEERHAAAQADPAYQAAVAQWEAALYAWKVSRSAQSEALRVAREAKRAAEGNMNICLSRRWSSSKCPDEQAALDAASADYAAAHAALREHDAGNPRPSASSHPCHMLPLGCN